MTKAKVALNNSKNHLKHPKDGSIHKKKQQKFKNTPNGKVPLINGTPSKISAKQISPKNGNEVMKSPKSPKSPKAQNGAGTSKKGAKNSPKEKKKAEEEDDENSEEDFNEGINISEIVSGQEDEDDDDSSNEDDDDSSDEDALPDVLATTLPDATDESDDDFDVTSAENKGVKMFRGTNKTNEEAEESDDDDDEEEDDEDDEEDEDEDEGKPVLGLSALLGDSIKDESGDEDFVGMETSEDDEDEEDDDDDDEDESDEEVPDQSLNSSNVTTTDDDEEEDDDEDEDDDDDDDSSPNLTDLLGTSLVDESDDNDFEADDDDADQDEDISSEEDAEETPKSKKKTETKSPSMSPEEKAQLKSEHDKRTIFVGNIPKDTKVQALTREFKKFGPIETVRLRGIIPGDPKMSLKVAAIKKNFHEKSKNICAYILYQNEESVKKALSMNGKKFEGNYLRVDRSERPKASDKKKAVFLGNLPFTVEDNELWEAFKDCGRIESVRIIRHRATGLGRGFGYINFETSEGAVLALSLNGTEISNRKIRVQSITGQEAAKKKQQQQKTPEKGGKRKHQTENESNNSPKRVKTENSETVERATHNSVNAERRTNKGKKRSQGDKQRSKSNSSSPKSDSSPTKFQGQTGASKNKKPKQDKTSKKKKQMAAKLLAKPKKP